MLGILICYASFHEFETYQKKNLERFVKCPCKVYILHSEKHPDPSTGHQINLNCLLNEAWNECDSFLLFDNDMILLTDFHEPEESCWYLPQVREGYEYAWPNLLYFKKHELMQRIWFENNSDSGGSTWRYLEATTNKRTIEADTEGLEEYQEKITALGKQHGIGNWFERYILNGCQIFHFRALSNWTKYPHEYQEGKKALILETVKKINQM